MARGSRQVSDNESSGSEHSPSPELTEPPSHPPSDSIDPEQDALVGVTSLDDRFNEEQLRRLVLKKDEYRCAGRKQRKEIALKTGEMFATEMLSAGVKMSEADRSALFEVCDMPLSYEKALTGHKNVKSWYAQRARHRREPIEWTIHWSGRQVFHKEQKEKIEKTQMNMYQAFTGKVPEGDEAMNMGGLEADEDAIEPPVDKPAQPFHFLQRAITAEWDALSSKEQEVYEEKARLWRSLGPDEEERRRTAEAHLPKTMRSFAHSAYRQMGARLFILASWEDVQGRIITVPFDFNHELGRDGKSYKIEHRSYLESIDLLQHFSNFSQKIWPDKDVKEEREGSPMDITFTTTEEGRPVLPDPGQPHPVLKPYCYLPNLVRKFMDADYSLARGIPVNQKGGHQVPWRSLLARLPDFIDPEFLPDGWTGLKDPGALGVNQCRVLLNHWWKRQQDGRIPFQFHHWEASPPTYQEDGATLKTAGKMVVREPLPLLKLDDKSEGDTSPKKPATKRVRKKKSKSKPVPVIPASTSVPSDGRSNDRKSKKSSTKRQQSPSKSVESDIEQEQPRKGRKGPRRTTKAAVASSSEGHSSRNGTDSDGSQETQPRGRSRRRKSTSPGLVEATGGLTIHTPQRGRSPETRVKGQVIPKAKRADIAERRATGGPAEGRKPKEGGEAKTPRKSDGKERSLSKVKSGKAKSKAPRKVTWDDINVDQDEDSSLAGGQDEGSGQEKEMVEIEERQVSRGQSGSPKKQSAEDRDILALANSSRYRVESPKRKRTAVKYKH